MTTSSHAAPLMIDSRWNRGDVLKTAVYTDIKPHLIQDTLETYIRIGAVKDTKDTPRMREDECQIEIISLGDVFETMSNTGDLKLTAGIIGKIFADPYQYQILPLDQAPATDEQVVLVARKHGWTPEIARQKIERTQEILQVDPQDAVAFLLEQFLPNKIICDGCNVNLPHEHRCHGNRSVVRGERMDKPCQCLDCFVVDRLGLTS